MTPKGPRRGRQPILAQTGTRAERENRVRRRPRQAANRTRPKSNPAQIDPGRASAGRSALLVLDVLDDFRHVVLVLAELGGVFDELLLLFLLLGGSHRLALFDDLGLLDRLDLDLFCDDRLDLLLRHRGNAGAAGLQEGFGIILRAAFRADDLAERLHQIVVARPAARADTL